MTKGIDNKTALELKNSEETIELYNKEEYIEDAYLQGKIIIAKRKTKTLIQRMISENQITQEEAEIYLNNKKSTDVVENEAAGIEDNTIGV